MIEALAEQTPGVLLLTATPEQFGRESHFARLRLLDADRFYDYEALIKEEEQYAPVADAVTALFSGEKLSDEAKTKSLSYCPSKMSSRCLKRWKATPAWTKLLWLANS